VKAKGKILKRIKKLCKNTCCGAGSEGGTRNWYLIILKLRKIKRKAKRK